MLSKVLELAGLDPRTAAVLLGLSPTMMAEWSAGQRAMPSSVVAEVSTILGIDPSLLSCPRSSRACAPADLTSAVWYKFREETFTAADREVVLLVRRLGNSLHELEQVTGSGASIWREVFRSIQNQVDQQRPPREQGRQAARIFRACRCLGKGAGGIGEVLRGNLRAMGILVVESPIRESKIEGCSFYVGPHPDVRPCIFANSHRSTWFRRNWVIGHELGHAIFDVPGSCATADFEGCESAGPVVEEQRADAFAQELLVPQDVLRHAAQLHGLRWDALDNRGLAALVAATHIEQRTVLAAAEEHHLLTTEQSGRYRELDIAAELRELSEHALSTGEYIKRIGAKAAALIGLGRRCTSSSQRSIHLPVPYISAVLDAVKNLRVSVGRAAELLMIDEATFAERFPESVPSLED